MARKKHFHLRNRRNHPKIKLSPRFLARSVAKAKMRRAGVEKPNKKMRYGNWREWAISEPQPKFNRWGKLRRAK